MARRATKAYLQGEAELQATLERMLRATEDLRPTWPLYHEAFKMGAAKFFLSGGGGTWPQLKNRYAEWKARHGYTRRPLIMTKRLLQSLGTDGQDHIYEPYPRYMKTGTSDPVANIHFSKKRRKRRPFDARSEVMQAHFREAVKKHAAEYERMWGSGIPS